MVALLRRISRTILGTPNGIEALSRITCASGPRLSALDDISHVIRSTPDQESPCSTSGQQARWMNSKQYESHVPLSGVGRAAVALGSAVGALLNPARADLVAALGETTGTDALRRMHARMQASSEGSSVLRDRPRITSETASSLAHLPETSFGGAYHAFMAKRGFDPDDRPPVRFVDDPELAYVARRAREAHDLWHVLFGCPTTVLGELAIKAIEFAQTGMPMAALSVAGAQFRLTPDDRRLLWGVYAPWAMRTGLRCADLMCVYYERLFEEDIDSVRSRLRITKAPTRREAMAMAGMGVAQSESKG